MEEMEKLHTVRHSCSHIMAAHRLQHTHNILTVGHVLLAAKRIHHGAGRMVPAVVDGADFLFKLALTQHLFFRQQHLCSFQIEPPNRHF